ncbi:MAG: RNA 2'-phosphotransferase [Myxococcales bacterium]|nr:RNA 2'-phosphotransferase [Myxococcales bacterium]
MADLVRVSKFLSKHLRHDPAGLGLTLEVGGWVAVDVLLAACARRGMPISRELLAQVVAGSDKQRFAFDGAGLRIRANQGHSVAVDLQLSPQEPPAWLFHGTTAMSLAAILREGLQRMRRHHVHLSADEATARRVGGRRGEVVLLGVDAAAMQAAGAVFYRSDNGVWLVDAVAPVYLSVLTAVRPR